jgi:hypothetical protein
MRNRPEDYEDIVFLFPPGSPANNEPLPMHLKPALIFNQQLPKLFMFSYFVREEDGELLKFVHVFYFPCLIPFQFRKML